MRNRFTAANGQVKLQFFYLLTLSFCLKIPGLLTMENTVRFNAQHRILLCMHCRLAIRPKKAISFHFRNVHKMRGALLKEIVECWSNDERLDDPHTAPLPADGGRPIEGLAVLQGYSCSSCRFLSINRVRMVVHSSEAAHPVAPGGGDTWARVQLQTWSGSRYARYWIVNEMEEGAAAEEEVEVEAETAPGVASDEAFHRMLAAYEDEQAAVEEKERRTASAPGGIDEESQWVRETGWAKHLAGKDLVRLYEASLAKRPAGRRGPGRRDEAQAAEEKRASRLGSAFESEMGRCAERLDQVPHETLRWLASIDPGKPAGRPFGLKEIASTMERYHLLWKRYLCYCTRAWQLGQAEAEEQLGVVFTEAQWALLDRIGELLEAPAVPGDDDEALQRAIFEFCIASLKQKVAGNVFVNPLLHFTAVLGIDGERRSWKRAADYTSQLAGILWCARALLLEHAFEGQAEDACEVSTEATEAFLELHHTWLVDGTHSPISTIIRIMSYGRGHREHETSPGKVLWEEDGKALRFLGERVVVADFCGAARRALAEAEALLNELLWGTWQGGVAVELPRVVDSLLFEGAGRSFATSGRNPWLRPGAGRVAGQARAALWSERQERWRQAASSEFLSRLNVFRMALLVCTHLWAGQPGRGPEVMTMRHCDTQQLVRNIFVHDGQVLLVTDRDKHKAIRGVGRKVARFLPEAAGRMMVAYVAWLLPFETMLRVACGFPKVTAATASFLWRDPGKGRWDTTVLSRRLGELTSVSCGVQLTVSTYRHVAIEMGRRIRGIMVEWTKMGGGKGEGEEDFDEAAPAVEEETVDPVTGEKTAQGGWDCVWDLQATHGSKVALQHYAVHLQFPGQLQPEMVATYRQVSRLWHRFLEGGGAGAGNGGKKQRGGEQAGTPAKRARLATGRGGAEGESL